MSRVLKWTGFLLVLFLILLFAIPALISSDWFKDIAEDELSEIIGRSVTINGNIDVAFSLTPRIRIENMQLGNAPWAEAKHMASVRALELSLDLPKLLSGEVVIADLTVF